MKKMAVLTVILTTLLLFGGCAAGEKVIAITFAGDCTLGTEERTRNAPDSFDSVANEKGYDWFFANFLDVFSGDDCTVVNCEGVLSDNSDAEVKDKPFRFRGPEEFGEIFRRASVEAVSLANNHARDYGWNGLWDTMRVLEEKGIGWARDVDFWIFEKENIRIAFAAADHGIFQKSGYLIRKKLLEMSENGEINAAVVLIHEGREYFPKHLGNQERFADYFIRFAGADLVVMHHPHVVQGIRILNNRSIFYSLGNFVFGGHHKVSRGEKGTNSLYTLVVQARMHFTDNGVYTGQQIVLYPAYDSGADPENNYQPVRITAEEAIPVWKAIQADTDFQLPDLQTDEEGKAFAVMDFLPADPENGDKD